MFIEGILCAWQYSRQWTIRCEQLKPCSQEGHSGIGYSEYGVISRIIEMFIMQSCILRKNLRKFFRSAPGALGRK